MTTATGRGRREDGSVGAALPVVAMGAAFLAMFDATVINLAVPDLARDYPSVSLGALTWTITLYAVMFAALLAPAGRLADIVGSRAVHLAGLGLFTAASVLCALAPGVPWLLAGRGLQALGAAAMVPASLALLLRHTLPERRARAIGLWGMTSAVAAALGPSVGGLLVDLAGWRSVFWINVPIGVALIWYARELPRTAGRGGARPDLLGTVLLALGVGAVVLGVGRGDGQGRAAGVTGAALVAGALMLALVLYRSTRHPVPAVETRLWRSRPYALANVASFFYGAALFPWLLVGILFLTQVWGYSELEAGLAQSPGAVTAALSSVLVPRLVNRYGPHVVIVGGALVMAAVAVWINFGLTVEPRFLAFWLPSGLLVGAGMGALANGVASAAAMSVAPEQFAGAVGLNTAARQVGGALGLAALVAILPAVAAPGRDDYVDVYLSCGGLALAAAAAGAGIAVSRRAARAQDAPKKGEVTP